MAPSLACIGRLVSDAQASNIVEWSVSELSGALRRTIETAFGHVRVRGEISGFRGAHASGHCYFSLKDQNARLEAVIWKTTFGRLKFRPQEGARGDRHGADHELSGFLEIPDRDRQPRTGGRRSLDGASRGAAQEACRRGPVRRGAQEAAPLSAAGHRGHHLSDGRRDPRHPASSRRPVSEIGSALARARARRELRGGSRGGDPGLQRLSRSTERYLARI